MRIPIDLSNYKDRRGGYVTPGRYLVTVEDVESDTSKAGNPYLRVFLRVKTGELKGTVLRDQLTLSEKAMFRVVGFLEALTGKDVPRKEFNIETDQWLNRSLVVDVDDTEYPTGSGKMQSNISGYMRAAIMASAAQEAEDLPVEGYDASGQSGVQDSIPPVEDTPAPAEMVESNGSGVNLDTGEVDLETIDL